MTCNESRDRFAEALYGELPDARMAELNAHLATCGSCNREFGELKRTLDVMSRRTRVEPTPAEWAEFSATLEERLKAEAGVAGNRPDRAGRPNVIHWLPSFRPAWGYGIAALLLVAFGIYMGRTLFNRAPGGPGPAAVDVPQTEIAEVPAGAGADREALAYLERSRNLLLGLTNIDEDQVASVDFERSRKVSRELYNKGSTLAVALDRPSQQQLRQLVQGLQIILLQLSNMEVGNGTPVIEMVRKGVDSKSILLKINLEAIRAALNDYEYRPALPGDDNSL